MSAASGMDYAHQQICLNSKRNWALNMDAVDRLSSKLRQFLDPKYVLTDRDAIACYSYDAFLINAPPQLVVLPGSAAEVAEVVRHCIAEQVPYTARGSGTGYAGGSLAVRGGAIIVLSRMCRIVEICAEERWAWVEPGVRTIDLQSEVAKYGLRYPPDPSSYEICTIGGNVATNAGGPHSLSYGVTSNYVCEIEIVDPGGHLERIGTPNDLCALDLRGLFVGSEGTFGIVVGVRLRLLAAPEEIKTIIAEFNHVNQATAAILEIATAGELPHALDMTAGFFIPREGRLDVIESSILYIDCEGFADDVSNRCSRICLIVSKNGGTADILSRADLMARRFAKSRERITRMIDQTGLPRYFLFDAVIPRSEILAALQAMQKLCISHDLPMLNTFHAGDGNLHPMPFFDPDDVNSTERLMGFWRELLTWVSEAGGAASGEHGIGIEKLEIMRKFYSSDSLRLQARIKQNIDPANLCNPGKILPDNLTSVRVPRREQSQERSGSKSGGWICQGFWLSQAGGTTRSVSLHTL